ncbi:scaffold protein Nfu/NifU N terminal-domain-containing protein [Aspergillus varians]
MAASSKSTNMIRRTILNNRLAAQISNIGEGSSRTIRPFAFGSFRGIHISARLPTITASDTRHRPTLRPHQLSASHTRVNGQPPIGKRTIFIQTETTPNPDALKFIPNHRVLPEGFTTSFLEYLSPRSTLAPPHPSSLAANLFNVDGVQSVFFGTDFITVTKAGDANWAHIKPEVFSLITQAVTSGEAIVTTVAKTGENAHEADAGDSLSYNEEDDEVVSMIKELLETRIRPAIQEDGGDIEFRGFENGIVMLKLRGACRTCDSSTVTLRNGIESMLMHYVSIIIPYNSSPCISNTKTNGIFAAHRSKKFRALSKPSMRRRRSPCTNLPSSRRSSDSRRAPRRLLRRLWIRLLEDEPSFVLLKAGRANSYVLIMYNMDIISQDSMMNEIVLRNSSSNHSKYLYSSWVLLRTRSYLKTSRGVAPDNC